MRLLLLILPAICVILPPGAVLAEEVTCSVRYISAEHVYLDTGELAGLAVGMDVGLVRDGKVFAELEVVYTADHSASCRVLHQSEEIRPGDTGLFEIQGNLPEPQVTAADSLPSVRTRETWSQPRVSRVEDQLEVRGSLAMQWDHNADGTDRDLQTNLVSIPFRLRVQHPAHDWNLRARGSVRRIARAGFSSSTPTEEWRNRIRSVALLRQDRRLVWNFALGRISTRATASAGPFDGVAISRKVGNGFRVGTFTGFTPRWADYGFNTEDRVSGLSVHLDRFSPGGNRLNVILAGVGRYHQGEVSREYLVLTSTWNNGSGLTLVQSGELDFNREWRKEATGARDVTLSSVALTGRYRMNRRVSFTLGYDDRQRVRTWETRSLPDSLFVDAGRQGLRAGFNIRFAAGRSLNLRASLRTDERTGNDTRSWNGRLYLPNFPAAGSSADVSLRGFSGPWLAGLAPRVGIERSIHSSLRVRAECGYYTYSGQLDDENQSNTWLKFLISKDINRQWSLAMDYRQDWGENMAGQRWFLELRHRF